MPLPAFQPAAPPIDTRKTLSRNAAAIRLGISRGNFDKLVSAGILAEPLTQSAVEQLAQRPTLAVATGELTVLRTAARTPAYDDRQWIGFHIDHTNTQLDDTSLRWWRAEPDRIIDNLLYAVTVATIPVCVYAITGINDTQQRGTEKGQRYRFDGQLLARLTPDANSEIPTATYQIGNTDRLYQRVVQIMGSRISVTSGGPIAYLDSPPAD